MIDDFWTRSTIWLAITLYAVSVNSLLFRRLALARWTWTLGCCCYVTHVAFAFHLHHAWSHQQAAHSTLQQTLDVTGFRTGTGIYINYFFTLLWLIDVNQWWISGDSSYQARSSWLSGVIHGFFLFMIFNGAIVFATGVARWLGVAVIISVGIGYYLATRKRDDQ